MRKRAIALTIIGVLGLGSIGAEAAVRSPTYKNCDQLHRQLYKYGVAKTKKAARKQVNTGHYKPRVNSAVYSDNTRLDADKDGTACEVTA